MHVVVVGDVVPPVMVRRRERRADPEGVDTEPLQMVELRDEPRQVADPVAVRIGVGAGIHLVQHEVLPPHQTGSCSRARFVHVCSKAATSSKASPRAIATSARLKAIPPWTRGSGTPPHANPDTNVASAPPAEMPAPSATPNDRMRGASVSNAVASKPARRSTASGR